MGVGILISSYHCTWEFWYLLTIVHTQRLSEVPRGWDFFYIFLPLYTLKVNLKFHGGGNFDIFLPLYTLKVNLKFHGGGNFDIFWTLHTLQGQFEVPWVCIFSYLLPTIVHTQRWIWSSMGVGILISYHCTLKGQCEVPWGWEFRRLLNYHCTHAKVNLKVHEGGNFGIFLRLRKLKVNLKLHGGGNFDIFPPLHTQRSSWSSMGVGNLISSYWCTHSMSIWSSMGVGILISSYHCTHSKVYLKFHGVGFLISSYHCTHSRSIWNSMGVGFGYLLTLVHIQGQFEVHGVSQGSACDHREGVRSCAIRSPALHKRSCTIREVAYLQSGWCRIAVGHTMHSKGAWSSVNVECDVVRA